MKGSRL